MADNVDLKIHNITLESQTNMTGDLSSAEIAQWVT